MKVKIKLEGSEAKHALNGLLGGLSTQDGGRSGATAPPRRRTSMTAPPALRLRANSSPMSRMARRAQVSRHG